MHRYNIHTLVHLPHWEQEKLTPFYVAAALRTFAISTIGIYIPIYIFQITKTNLAFLTFNEVLLVVISYYLLLRLTELLSNFPVAKLLTKIGFKTSTLFSNLLLLVEIIFLVLAQRSLLFFVPAAIFSGFLIPFYWLPYHFIFAEKGTVKKFGKQVSLMIAIKRLVTVLGPLIGGFAISRVGFTPLYTLVFLLTVLSSLPIFYMQLREDYGLGTLRNLLGEVSSKEFFPNLASFFGVGAEGEIQEIFWPMFVFVLIGSFSVLGLLTSIALFFSLFILYLVGAWVDQKDKTRILKFGSFSNSFVWILRLSATTLPRLFAVDILDKILRSFRLVPFDTLVYTKAQSGRTLQFLVLREWAINVGRFVVLIMISIMIILGINWLVAFILAAIFSVLAVFMGK